METLSTTSRSLSKEKTTMTQLDCTVPSMNIPTNEELRKVFLEGLIESAKDVTSREDPQDAGYRALFEFGRTYNSPTSQGARKMPEE